LVFRTRQNHISIVKGELDSMKDKLKVPLSVMSRGRRRLTVLHSCFSLFWLLNQSLIIMAPTTRTRGVQIIAASAAPTVSIAPKQRGKAPPKTPLKSSLVDSGAASEDVAARKRRKVEVKAEPPPRPPIDYSGLQYRPSTLPVEPNFSVQEAQDRLIRFDPRFKGLFDSMPCRPFVEPFEALDPYRTLTTSIVGQQVSHGTKKAADKAG
jgi:hypothetical protein